MSDIVIYGAGKTGLALKNLLKNNNVVIYDDNLNKSQVTTVNLDEVRLVVTSPGIPPSSKLLLECNKRNIPVVGELELCNELCRGDVVSVTGTNGKTTVTRLIKHMLDANGCNSYLLGNGGVPFAQEVSKVVKGQVVVLETSSFQLAGYRNFAPYISVVTNIDVDHLDYHGSYQNYVDAKLNNFLGQAEDQFSIFNMDDRKTVECSGLATSKRLYYSVNKQCDCYYKDGFIFVPRLKVQIAFKNALALHNLSNVLCSVLVCSVLGFDLVRAVDSVKTFDFGQHRLQLVAIKDSVRFVDDSKATNVHAVISALQSISDDVYAILGGVDKGFGFDALFNSVYFKRVKFVALIGQTADKLYDTAIKFDVDAKICDSLEEATCLCYKKAKEVGGTVLLSPACSSFDMFVNYQERGQRFKSIVEGIVNG